MTHATVWQS